MFSSRNHQDPKHKRVCRRERLADYKRQDNQPSFFAAENSARSATMIVNRVENNILASQLSLSLKISLASAVLLMTSAYLDASRIGGGFQKIKPFVGTRTDESMPERIGKRF